jgi:hypothetical protein
MTSLTELREKVERATGTDREIDALIAVVLDGYFVLPAKFEGDGPRYGYIDTEGAEVIPGHAGDMLVRKYTSSIDAALALAERKLPGWTWSVDIHDRVEGNANGWAWARLATPNSLDFTTHRATAPTPPLAILSALLRALESQEQDGG